MSQILIRHAPQDQVAARRLRDALEHQGFDVADDSDLDAGVATGERARKGLGDALNAARCVVVLWSNAARGSRAVRLGARVARLAGKLVPVRIDDSALPSDLGEGHPADLSDWHGDIVHPEFRRLTETLDRAVTRRRRRRARTRARAWLFRATIAALLVALGIAGGIGIARYEARGGSGARDTLEAGLGRFFNGQYVEAEAQLRRAADAGNGAAAYYLARMYRDGLGVRRDPPRALEWAEKGAALGNALAQNMVGLLRDARGASVADDKAALAAWLDAAGQGLAWGAFNAGYFLESGRGVGHPDPARAFEYYRRAADDGNAAAGNAIGDLYRAGRGVPQDLNRAVAWYRWAADRGSAAAQLTLGYLYANGQGVTADDARAVELYERAAHQGLPGALNNLGFMYEHGRGVAHDLGEAAILYRRAAELGNKDAEGNLARTLEAIRMRK
ncbi:MAG: toll/interleukin-1 receptor domain-containing protein [Proteobacteria bacterium]|nr:toll/interleukin-1 receptor domain-containing protein [Pseudomonadota bacterium]